MKWKTTSIAIIAIIMIVAAALFAYFNYGTGILEIKVTDARLPENWDPATQVYLNYSAIEIHRSQPDNESGWFTVIEKGASINLTRTLDVNQTIGAKNLQPGAYNLIRFRILGARVTVSGANNTATPVPGGILTVAVTPSGIRVNAGQNTALLIDINVKVKFSQGAGFSIVPEVRATPV